MLVKIKAFNHTCRIIGIDGDSVSVRAYGTQDGKISYYDHTLDKRDIRAVFPARASYTIYGGDAVTLPDGTAAMVCRTKANSAALDTFNDLMLDDDGELTFSLDAILSDDATASEGIDDAGGEGSAQKIRTVLNDAAYISSLASRVTVMVLDESGASRIMSVPVGSLEVEDDDEDDLEDENDTDNNEETYDEDEDEDTEEDAAYERG